MITINVSDRLANQLQKQASSQHLTPEQLALRILAEALEPRRERLSTLDQIVAKIKSTPRNPLALRPAEGSLQEALLNSPEDPEFDLQAWERDWAAVEQEIKATSAANAHAEGLD